MGVTVRVVGILAAFLLSLYLWVGVFPVAPIEGDGNGIANGAQLMAQRGFGDNELAYRYAAQPGTYAVVAGVDAVLGVPTLTAFALLSAVASFVALICGALLVGRIAGAPPVLAGLVLLLFQESYTAGYYANSTVIAAALGVAAMLLVSSRDRPLPEVAARSRALPGVWLRPVLAGVLFGLGVWMRFDLALMAPVALLIAAGPMSGRTNMRAPLVFGVCAAVVALGAIYGSGSSIPMILAEAGGHLGASVAATGGLGLPLIGAAAARTHLSFFSLLAAALAAAGVVWLVARRRWYLLAVFATGVVPLYAVYFGALTTPKYLFYLLPFFVLPPAAMLAGLAVPPRKPFYAFLALPLLLQFVLGVRAEFVAKPYIAPPQPTLAAWTVTHNPIAAIARVDLVVGAGTAINTHDGPRLSSGIAFAPLTWRAAKVELNEAVVATRAFLAARPAAPAYLLAVDYEARQLALHMLLDDGYACEPLGGLPPRFNCVRGDRRVVLTALDNDAGSEEVLPAEFVASASPEFLYLSTIPRKRYALQQHLAASSEWRLTPVSIFAFALTRIS